MSEEKQDHADQEARQKELLTTRTVHEEARRPAPTGSVHCILTYTLHAGFKFDDGQSTVHLAVNGKEVGELLLNQNSKSDLNAETSVSNKWLINPQLHEGDNEILVYGHIEGLVNRPWISARLQVTKNGETDIDKRYFAHGTMFLDPTARIEFKDTNSFIYVPG